jgi:hypothetical protein
MTARRSWALVLMGAWMTGTICMSVVATENFYTIDRLLAANANPALGGVIDRLGRPETRDLLRYLSSELNRLYFQMWNGAQVVIAAAVLTLIVGARQRTLKDDRAAVRGVAVMALIVFAMFLWLTPQIVTLGRGLDFVPRDPAPPGMQRFWVLHAAYTSLEMLKLLIGVLVTWSLVRTARAERQTLGLTAA